VVFPLKKTLLWHKSIDPGASERPVVVFVHHYGGNANTIRRHAEILMALGFDCVSFTLSQAWPHNIIVRWGKEIENALNQINRTKILFCFSGPAASGLHALASHLNIKNFDILGFICDSGPFMDAWECSRNLVIHYLGITNPVLRELRLATMMFRWGYNHNEKLKTSVEVLAQIRPDLPILSFRGKKDLLIPIEKIQMVFQDPRLKNVTAVFLDTGHLTGLKDKPQQYESALSNFLAPWPKTR
jgi:pimeloyl-ACP methyl ester carboxylesterase